MLGQIGEQPHNGRIELLAQRIVHRPQFQIHQRIVQAGNAAPVQLIAQPVPGLLGGRAQLAPIQKHMALVGVQIERQAALDKSLARRRYSSPVSESRQARITPAVAAKPSPSLSRCWRSWPDALVRIGRGKVNGPVRRRRSGCCRPPARARPPLRFE